MNAKNVTLTIIEGFDDAQIILNAIKVLIYSSKDLDFSSIQILSPNNLNKTSLELLEKFKIEHKIIKPLNYIEYNLFLLKHLHEYIQTQYCLLTQNDGYVLNGNLWHNDFLSYDYIGAPCWGGQVGNGGFSLRSIKLLKTTADAPFELNEHSHFCEDYYICQTHREYFLEKGIKFAPMELAKKFSMEPYQDHFKNVLFGGHRIRNNYWLN
jgi:hypothetical protein